MRLLVIPGSLRAAANSRKVLNTAVEEAPEGVETELYDEYGELPIFNEEIEDPAPAAVARFRERLESADGVLVVTPEYNASIPGGIKNAVDWASRPPGESVLGAKPAAVIANSGSPFGGTWAGEQLQRALTFAGAKVIERESALGGITAKLDGEVVGDPEARAEISAVVNELVSAAGAKLGEEDLDLARTSTS